MKSLCPTAFPAAGATTGRTARPALRLLAAALLLIAPTLGTVVASGSAPVAAASPASQVRVAASFSEGRCTSGDTSSVTVVIDFQQLGGGTTVRCAHGLSAGARGTSALAAAGIGYTGTARWGGAFVCRIQGRPGPTEVLPLSSGGYRETCTDTPPAKAYWSYWQADEGGAWAYSQLGVQSQKVRLGGFEGWSFSLNASSDTNPAPGVDTSLVAPAPPPTTAQPTTSRPAPPTTRPRPTTARPPAPPVTSRATTPRPTTQRPAPMPTTQRPPTPQPDPGTRTAPTTSATPTVDPDAPSTDAPAAGTTAAGTTAAGRTAAGTTPAGTTPAGTTGGSVPSPSTSGRDASGSVLPASSSTGSAPSSRVTSGPGTSGSAAADPGTAPSAQSAAAGSTAGPVAPTYSAATDPNLATTQVEPGTSSPWPVIGVLALALIAGGAAIVVARRRRDDGV